MTEPLAERLALLDRIVRLRSGLTRLITRSTLRSDLLDGACRLAVDAGFAMAWVGRANPDFTVPVVAAAGQSTDYTARLRVRWDDSSLGMGPTGRAVAERRVAVATDLSTDPAMEPWRDAVLERGFRCSAACPIVHGDRVFGALSLYAREADAFPADVVAVLEDIGADLGFALQALEDRAERVRYAETIRAIFDSSPVPVVALSTGAKVLAWNPAAERVFGWKSSEVEGRFPPFVSEGKREEFYMSFRQLLEGRAVQGREIERVRKDGTHVYLRLFAGPLYDPDGQVTGVLALLEDITREQTLETMLGTFFHSSAVGVVLGRVTGEVEDANDEYLRIIGSSREDLLAGRIRWSELTHADFRALEAERVREAVERGACSPFEKQNVRQDGTPVWVLVGLAILPPERTRTVAFVIDIDARKRAEEEVVRLNRELEARVEARTADLAQANQELEAFSYSVSHDLRAPLRSIDGFAQILLEDHAPRLDDDGRRLLGNVQRSAGRMAQLIDDLLAFSRVGRLALRRTRVDMQALAREALLEVGVPDGVAVTLDTLPDVVADAALLRQVWINLLGNAIKFSRGVETPRVRVDGWPDGDGALFQVRDNGVGFDGQYVGKLFTVFQRLHRAEEFPGTGVGLALVRRIIERHGGRVEAEGREGEGATFRFWLPREM